jgi:hypothetical protein
MERAWDTWLKSKKLEKTELLKIFMQNAAGDEVQNPPIAFIKSRRTSCNKRSQL